MYLELIENVAVLRLEAGKANAMRPEFLVGLNRLLDEFEASGAMAVVLTGYDTHFCAGLDLVSLAGYDAKQMNDFMEQLDQTMLRLLSCPKPVIAAMNGHAVAGGCLLAMMADFRILADSKIKCGLNESQLGLSIPLIGRETLEFQLSPESIRTVIEDGNLYLPAKALEMGLVDSVVSPETVLDRALLHGQKLAQEPAEGLTRERRDGRQRALQRLSPSVMDQARQSWLEEWFSETTQEKVSAFATEFSGSAT